MSTDGASWALLNCSPEIRQQIEAFPGLHPRGPRHSPIAAILFTNGDLDHTLGLLSLRESHPLIVYATEPVRRGFIEGNVLYKTLERFPGQVTWRPLKAGREEAIVDAAGKEIGLTVEAVAIPGKPPVHLETLAPPDPEDNVGLRIRERATGQTLVYLSGVGARDGVGATGDERRRPPCSSTARSGRATSCRRWGSAPSAPRRWRTCRWAGQVAAWRSWPI